MPTLLQQCNTLDSKLNALSLAKRHAADHRVIQQRAQEWNDQNQKLKAVKQKVHLLVLASEDANVISKRQSSLRTNASTILERLQLDGDINDLTKDASWHRLLKSVEGLKDDLDSAICRSWRNYLDEQAALEDPSMLSQRTPRTPQNDISLKDYRASYDGYVSIRRLASPRTADDLTNLTAHIDACRQAFARLTFDLPEDVKRFFEAINAGTATLAHVNPTVLAWIGENGQLEGFRIRSGIL